MGCGALRPRMVLDDSDRGSINYNLMRLSRGAGGEGPIMEIQHCRIAGMGAYLPERVVTNDELGKFLGVTNDWIVERCGIRERRFAA